MGTELGTLKGVGVFIERLYGVKFGQTQIWRILGGLGSRCKSPSAAPSSATNKLSRRGGARPGPLSKKAKRDGRLIVFIDVSIGVAAHDGLGILVQPNCIVHGDIVAGRLVVLDDWDLSRRTINAAFQTRDHLRATVRLFEEFPAECFRVLELERRWTR